MGLILGFGSSHDGYYGEAGADYGYFVVPRVAPGIEAMIQGGKGLLTTGMVMPNVHLVPFREGSFALLLSGRAGRVLVADHADGWGAGAGIGAAVFQTAHLGFQIGYQYLQLYPRSFCADIVDGCAIHGLSLGFIAGF